MLGQEFDLVPIVSKTSTTENVCNQNTTHLFISLYQTLNNGENTCSQMKELLLEHGGIWGILEELSVVELDEVAPLLVNMYFSIPKKVCSAASAEVDGFFFEHEFNEFTAKSFRSALSTPMDKVRFLKFSFAIDRLDGFGMSYLKSAALFPEFISKDALEKFTASKLTAFFVSVLGAIIDSQPLSQSLFLELDKLLRMVPNPSTEIVMYIIDKGFWSFLDLNVLFHAMDFETVGLLAGKVLEKWANKPFSSASSFAEQFYFANIMASILSFISPEMYRSSEAWESMFFDGVSNRLDHADPQIRLIGMTVAEFINSFHLDFDDESSRKLDFDLDSQNEIVQYIRTSHKYADDIMMKVLEIGPLPQTVSNASEAFAAKSPSTVPVISENEPKNSKFKTPIFLSDCLKVLRTNDDPDVINTVLTRLGSTYTSSSHLDKEMNSVSLFKTLSAMSDKFDIADFDAKRLDMMETLSVKHISLLAPHIVADLFGMNQLVLNQKMEYLQVICGATRQVFSSKLKSNPIVQASGFLKHFEKSFQNLELSRPKSSSCRSKEAEFLQHLFIPLLKRSIRSFDTFTKSHVMFLDKFLWLTAILLSVSRNQLLYPELVDKYIDLVLIASKCEHLLQAPVKSATILGLAISLENWPVSMKVLDNYDRLRRIYDFINTLEITDAEQGQLLASVALSLENICNPNSILKETSEQMSLDFKAIRIE